MSTMLTRIVVNGLQLPANGMTAAETRAMAVQEVDMEPVSSTPGSTENGEENVTTQTTQGA
jgi:hypothetical protein